MNKRIVLLAIISFSLTGFLLLSNAQTNALSGTPEATKPCFKCNGTGTIKCPVCKNGQVDCPGPCLKASKGVWQHLDVAGHSPNELWQKFYTSDGQGWSAWTQGHIGQVIEMQDGKPVNVGACKICGGAGHVACKTCGGTGTVVCDICDGKKVVPVSWTPSDNPKLRKASNTSGGSSSSGKSGTIQLKDGRTVHGRITISSQSTFWIKTDTGETIKVDKNDVVDIGPGAM